MLPQRRLDALPYPVRVVWAEPDRVIPFERFGKPMLDPTPGAELVRHKGSRCPTTPPRSPG